MKTNHQALAKIHIAKKQLKLDDDTYRQMLWTVCQVRSAKDLDGRGLDAFIKHLKSKGAVFKRKKRPTPAQSKRKQIAKINAMLIADGKREEYGDGIAKHMFNVERFEWCTSEQLSKIIAAIVYDQKKRGVNTGGHQ